MKRFLMIAVCLIVAASGLWLARGALDREGSADAYSFAEISRGDIESTISSSGTISAVGTVEVGTQVSGTIATLHADFNDQVDAGDLLAVLDTTLLHAAMLDAEASVERQEALAEQAAENLDRYSALHAQGLIGDQELLPYSINLRTEKASLKSARANLERAASNLGYAVIRAPIAGTVIQRAVEEGQTVAASMSTPLLFKLAEDLSRMEILAQVDESDIGSVREGQDARFTVLAHDDRTFTAQVRQIRLEPETVQNVVNYTVVLDVDNPEGLLMPGMTATIDFLVEQRHDVLLVPNAALRIRPTQAMMAAARANRERAGAGVPDSAAVRIRRRGGPLSGAAEGLPSDVALLWLMDDDGALTMQPVRTGATDGKNTEIVSRRGLSEGTRVITALTSGTGTAAASSGQRRGGFGGPPRPF